MKRNALSALLPLLLLLVASPPAAADVIPMDVLACNEKKEGDACQVDDQEGSCKQSTCSKLDYSQGTPPRTASYPCVKCVPGSPASTPTGGSEAPPPPSPTTEETGKNADAPEKPQNTDAPEKPSEPARKAGGCSVGGVPGDVPLWLFLLGSLALFVRRRV